jgi:hypothetical protein
MCSKSAALLFPQPTSYIRCASYAQFVSVSKEIGAQRGEKAATAQLILDTKPLIDAKFATPLKVDLAVKVEITALEGDVPRDYEEGKTYPKEEGVHREEGTVVKKDAGPTDDRSNDTETSGNGGEDELGAVAYPNNVGTCPDVKPRAKQEYDACKGVTRELEPNQSMKGGP